MAMNYFKEVNFTFLIVGHTKNAADRLFNSLKTELYVSGFVGGFQQVAYGYRSSSKSGGLS